jgi:RNA polymerase sigma-54 factor
MPAIHQKQVLKQLQKLSPQQIQMIKLLELPTLQLEQRVKQEIEENPVLEEQQTSEEAAEEGGMPKEVSMEEYLKEADTPAYKSYVNNHSRDDKARQVVLFEGMSMHEYLMEQLSYREMDEEKFDIARYIIGNIDDDGYLRLDLQSISDDIAFNYGKEIDIPELEEGLRMVQTLEPPGVGARDIRECLLLQLDRRVGLTPAQALAKKILESCFTEFTKKHFEKIMSRLGIDEEQFRAAIEEIQRLSPKPGNLYNEGGNVAAPYVIPDFILDEQDGELTLRLNSYNVPELKINRKYADMIRQMAHSSGRPSQEDKEALQFVKNKIDSAKWFISAIKQRQDTLMRTMQSIVDYQREYFLDGSESKLRPMILKDIADMTGLDVSTISRVVNSKYVQTGFGVISLKQLFSEAMQTDSGEEVSSYEIKNILSECIDGEDKRKPLTDEALMEILNDKGYRIARRTVAKYREMLGIPVARLRKEL